MATKSNYIKELTSITPYNTLLGTLDPLKLFFLDTYAFNDCIIFACDVYDADGEENTVFFSYDPETEKVSYLYQYFASEFFIYVIPAE